MRTQILKNDAFTAAYAASGNISIKTGQLPGLVRGMIFDFEQHYTTSSGAASQDWLWRIITSLNISGGQRQYLSWGAVRDIRDLYFLVKHRMLPYYQVRTPDYSNVAAADLAAQLPILFDPDPFMPDGRPAWNSGMMPVAAIPRDTDLAITGSWSGSGTGGTTGVTWSATAATSGISGLRVSMILAVLEAGDPEPLYYPKWAAQAPNISSGDPEPLYYPKWAAQAPNISGTSTGLGTEIDMPTNTFLRRSLLKQLVGSTTAQADVRYNGYGTSGISEIGIKSIYFENVKLKFWTANHLLAGGLSVADDNADNVQGAQTLAPGAAVISNGSLGNPGVVPIDWNDYVRDDLKGDPDVYVAALKALEQHNKDANALQLEATINSTTNLFVSLGHEAYEKIGA